MDRKTLIVGALILLLGFFFNLYLFFGLVILMAIGYRLLNKDPQRYQSKFRSYLNNILAVLLSLFVVALGIEIYLHLALFLYRRRWIR